MRILLLCLLSTSFSLADSLVYTTHQFVDLFEDGLRVGNLPKDCFEDIKDETEENPKAVIAARDMMTSLFNKYDLCLKLHEEDGKNLQEAQKSCEPIRVEIQGALKGFRKNYEDQQGVGITCSTENDNSAFYYITKSDNDRGDDEGATAKHTCRFGLFLKNGQVITLAASTALFTDIVGISYNGVDKLQQNSLERMEFSGTYEWWQANNLKLKLGAYVSRLDRGPNTFGSKLQRSWHDQKGLVTYEDISDKELAGYPKFGGGLIIGGQYVLVNKYTDHSQIFVTAEANAKAGYENKKMYFEADAGVSANYRYFPNKSFQGFYTGAMGNATFQANPENQGLWVGGGVELGYKKVWRDESGFDLNLKATHSENLLNREGQTWDASVIEQDNSDNVYFQDSQNFMIEAGVTYYTGSSQARKRRKDRIKILQQDIDDLHYQIDQTDNQLLRVEYFKQIEEKQRELNRLRR